MRQSAFFRQVYQIINGCYSKNTYLVEAQHPTEGFSIWPYKNEVEQHPNILNK
jgi:hypothetical protein